MEGLRWGRFLGRTSLRFYNPEERLGQDLGVDRKSVRVMKTE